jgi:hypothetical protein
MTFDGGEVESLGGVVQRGRAMLPTGSLPIKL